jgi:hypothetical protein
MSEELVNCEDCTDCIGGIELRGVTGYRFEGYEAKND